MATATLKRKPNLVVVMEACYEVYWHKTSANNLDRIKKHGLEPAFPKGEAKKLFEKPVVFLATDRETAASFVRPAPVAMLKICLTKKDIKKLQPDWAILADNGIKKSKKYDVYDSMEYGSVAFRGRIKPEKISVVFVGE